MGEKEMHRLVLVVLSALSVVFLAVTVFAQTDINVNDRNLIRFGGDVTVPAGQVVDNANAIGGMSPLSRRHIGIVMHQLDVLRKVLNAS
jgi:hypothetical protein